MKISKKLLDDVIAGDRKSQIELYRQCFNVLMSSAYRYHNNEDDAASVVNAAFLKILTKLDMYNDKAPFKAWIKRIIINEIIDEFRKNKRRKDLIVSVEDNHPEETSHADIDYDIEAEYLEEMLNELPKGTRVVFNLFAIDGFSHKEIADQLGIGESTSRSQLTAAKKLLRERLKKLGINRYESVN